MKTATELLLFFQRLPEAGPATYWRLMREFGSLESALNSPLSQISTYLKPIAFEYWSEYLHKGEYSRVAQQVKADLAWLKKHTIQLVIPSDQAFPQSLAEIHRPPSLLYVWGDASVLSMPQIAIIGSRNPTVGGRDNAFTFSRELVTSGFAVTSGLALGVDAVAHEGALDAGGKTIAVIGTGIDKIYPRRNSALAQNIVASGGAIVSEFPLGTGPLPGNFPQRNRIISGLSSGVLVVEAAIKSGSLITARCAIEQNREVFAIPGSIHNPLSKGGHALIKDGAKLVETAQDIVAELQGYLLMKAGECNNIPQQLSLLKAKEVALLEEEVVIDQHMGFDPVSFNTLMQRTGLEASELIARLMAMELKGLVEKGSVGYLRIHK